ncbi:N-acetylhexosamine 1-kinase [Capnocytophaga haemolytica]|uniref:Phosphotransferase n=1 Tax=Capnocytophaga haemolytica TaxID=45243 RepID=A0AAX2GW65_9FLAO|nr:aminoglycoside phosphotransferase family protein [Capnocytophaga haemolytica]AMD84943.1 phosphotransferase [Capnocytophaga haemolytica]SFO32511.1 N-acetylhexosamine 1-kinase [Capnocytophaga haemolytica]SNV06256.1 Phosphotransferase enzyme family [Capnocytophaga haemolytica]
MKEIAKQFVLEGNVLSVEPYGNGHINYTYLIQTDKARYILQGINSNVFKTPEMIISNIELLWETEPKNTVILNMMKTKGGKHAVMAEGNLWRAFPFAEGYQTFEFIEEPWQAEKAGRAYASFLKTFANIDTQRLQATIRDFHNGLKRFAALEAAYAQAKPARKEKAQHLYDFALAHKVIFERIHKAVDDGLIPIRVTHNDTKINNVLIHKDNPDEFKVIDLDTVMQGILLYDFGDFVRTSVSPTEENELDDSKIIFNTEFFEAICKGFSVMKDVMSPTEKQLIVDGAKYMIFIIGVRFLTDYFNNDVYFKISFEDENYIRARNQFVLLQRLEDKEPELRAIAKKYFD